MGVLFDGGGPFVFRIRRHIISGTVIGALVAGCAGGGFREPSREEGLQRILPSAVQIVVEQREGRRVRTASGVVLTSPVTSQRQTCYVLTAGHTGAGHVGGEEVYGTLGPY